MGLKRQKMVITHNLKLDLKKTFNYYLELKLREIENILIVKCNAFIN